jgi:DHA2 family multidrug resistance protein
MGMGIVLIGASFYVMSQFAPVMGSGPFVVSGFIQGLAMGLFFVPLSTIGFATLPGHLRVQGATVSNLIRNVGGSVGISVLQVILTNNMQVARAGLAQHMRLDNPAVQQLMPNGPTTQGLLTLNGLISRQAALTAYIDDFWLMTIVMACMLPILLFMRSPKIGAGPAPTVME